MMESVRKVEATRSDRIAQAEAGQHFPRMNEQEIEAILTKYHPDYKEGTKRPLVVGVGKGTVVPNELADLLEARPLIGPEDVVLDEIDFCTDVLVIGGGGAGCCAALAAASSGVHVMIATKLRLGDANTMMAEGGIQAADRDNDSPNLHFLDVMGGGHFTNDPELVRTLVRDAPSIIQWLEELGVMFDKEEDGTMRTLHGGGTCRRRMHSAGDMTGAEIMRTLRDEVQNRPNDIRVLEFSPAIELLMNGTGEVGGAVLLNLETDRKRVVQAKTVIIATGGIGRLHIQGFPTTNHYGATADGVVLAYRAGASLRFLDATQFHPTGASFPEQNVGLLITEKVRGAGAQVVNCDGEQFVYPLETRDVESAAIIRECGERGKGVPTPTGRTGCWLDSPMIEILKEPGTVQRDFPAKYRQFMRHDIDMSALPVLIYPTLHYQNGGVTINPESESQIDNLYLAGEVSGGIHGRNRLMGNSLLDILVFGRRAGINAARKSKEVTPGTPSLDHLHKFLNELDEAGLEPGMTSPLLLPDYVGKLG
jgi:succinate dehydrogenase/fumarate reductase flavoprotein subunit